MGASQCSVWRITHAQSLPDVASFVNRSGALAAGVRVSGTSMLLVTRSESGPETRLVTPSGVNAAKLAGSLASAVGGRSNSDVFPELACDVLVEGLVRSGDVSRNSMAGVDPVTVAETVARVLPVGCWFAVSFRVPSDRERRVARRWWSHRLAGVQTHYSRSRDVLLCRMLAGGPAGEDVSSLFSQVVDAVPGIDLQVVPARVWGRVPATVGGAVLGVVAAAGSYVLGFSLPVLLACWAVGAVLSVMFGAGVFRSPLDRVVRRLAADLPVVVPRRSSLLLVRPRAQQHLRDGRVLPERSGSYPFAGSVLLLASEQVAALACPHFGSSVGTSSLASREVPFALRAPIGPLVGEVDGVGVHLSGRDLWQGVGIFGLAGTGKSSLVHHLFGWMCLEKVAPSGRPGLLGASNAIVAFESKEFSGVEQYRDWAWRVGEDVRIFDVADDDTPALSLMPSVGSASERAAQFVDAMVYAFGDTAIAHRSHETLNSVLTLALLCTDSDAEAAKLHDVVSFMDFADVLLCGQGESAGVDLFAAVTARCGDLPDGLDRIELSMALSRLESMYGPKATPSKRSELVQAPKSKIALLARHRGWWRRRSVSFEVVLRNNWTVIINTGTTPSKVLTDGSVRPAKVVDEGLSKYLSSMLLFSLRSAILTTCSGWQDQRRGVTLLSDEIYLLAGNSGEVIKWLRNAGRSFGVNLVFATQYPEQLPSDVRQAVLGFGNLVWFRQSDPGILSAAVASLSVGGAEWSQSDISLLPVFHAVVSALVDGAPQPPIPVRVLSWRDRPDQFALEQGYQVDGR